MVVGVVMLSHDIEVAGLSVHVDEIPAIGAPRGTVIMLHGLTEDGPTQQAGGRYLAAHGFRILLPDAPGHGRTGLPESFTPEHRAAVVMAVIEQLAQTPVIVQGQSMGGESAALVAATRPEIVGGVIMEDPPILFAPPPSGAPDVMAHNKEWIGEMQQLDHAGQVAWGREHMPHWPVDEIELWARAKERCNVEVFDRASEASYPDWRTLLPLISARVLLFRGDPRECIIDENTALEFARLCPRTTVVEVPGASHCIRRDRPDTVNEAMLAFCNSVIA
jgi:pimeloyl-ACP methyl ester carboxylesterase